MQPSEDLRRALVAIFRGMNENAEEQVEHDFVFHLLESADDLARFVELCRNPGAHSAEQSKAIVTAVLYHSSGHIAQAARLFDVFMDPFRPDAQQPGRSTPTK